MRRANFDDTDRRLLSLLSADARRSTSALAKALGVPRTTVHERIERLEREGVIIGYSAVLNRNSGQKQVRSINLLSIAQKSQARVIEQLRRMPEVRLCLAMTGSFDLLLSIDTPQVEDLDAVVSEIVAIPGVDRCTTLVVLSTKFDRRTAVVPVDTVVGDLHGRTAAAAGL